MVLVCQGLINTWVKLRHCTVVVSDMVLELLLLLLLLLLQGLNSNGVKSVFVPKLLQYFMKDYLILRLNKGISMEL